MTAEDPASTTTERKPTRSRRRKFLIDHRGQLVPTMKVTGLVFVLLLLLNFIIAFLGTLDNRTIIAAAPELQLSLQSTEFKSIVILGIVSMIILSVVAIRSILLTHRTAGAAYRVSRSLMQVTAGKYDTSLSLRFKDNLRNLEKPFNEMTETLRKRAQCDAEDLSAIADEIDALGDPARTEPISSRVRELAAAQRNLGE